MRKEDDNILPNDKIIHLFKGASADILCPWSAAIAWDQISTQFVVVIHNVLYGVDLLNK